MTDNPSLTEALKDDNKPVIEPTPENYLGGLVGDGKKYANNELLAKSYYHGNLHIKELTDELHEAREKNQDLEESVNDIVKELRKGSQIIEPEIIVPSEPDVEAANISPELTEETVTGIVDKVLDKKTATDVAKANTNKSLSLLTAHYGSKKAALEAIAKVVGEDKVMEKMVNEIAASKPEATFRFVTGENPKPDLITNTPGLENSETPPDNSHRPSELTWAYCTKLRREKPQEYKTLEFRAKMEQAAIAYEKAGLDFYAT